jgi:hypothetical protein
LVLRCGSWCGEWAGKAPEHLDALVCCSEVVGLRVWLVVSWILAVGGSGSGCERVVEAFFWGFRVEGLSCRYRYL